MRKVKSAESVVALLQAMIDSGMLKPEQRQSITRALRGFRKALRTRNRRDVGQAVQDISKIVVEAIRDRGEE